MQTCTTPADEPRILCIVRNMVETAGQTCQTYSINLPMSLSCQTLIDDVKSKFEHLPAEISIVYRKPTEGGTTVSVSFLVSFDLCYFIELNGMNSIAI